MLTFCKLHCGCSGSRCPSATTPLLVFLHVTLEGARRCELAELVADHRLGDEHRDVLATVVDGEGVTEHVRRDDGPARPGLDDVLAARFVLSVHLLLQVVVDEGALLQATRHSRLLSALLASTAAADDQLVAGLAGAAGDRKSVV